MAADEIAAVLTAMGRLIDVLRRADPADKATVYRHLGLILTLKPESQTVQVQAQPNLTDMGFRRVRGGTRLRGRYIPVSTGYACN
jgi:site-specific DNA recombinase